MDKHLIRCLEDDIKRYVLIKDIKEKEAARNIIFTKMSIDIDRWLISILVQKKIYPSKHERLSLCWDCFVFCLHHYHPEKNIPLPNHFYGYTKFFLLSWLSEKGKSTSKNANMTAEIEDGNHDRLDLLYDQIDELRKFKETIPNDYKEIFDDALMSMAGRPKDKVAYRKSSNYGYYKYCEAKKVFKLVIDFLLRK